MRRIPVTAYAEIVAAALVIQIVVEAAKLAVLEPNPRETRPARHRRRHRFHHNPDAPLFVSYMGDFVANSKKEAFSFAERWR
jgi:hypothetical protein